MRISDWSSDVCSSDLSYNLAGLPPGTYRVDVTADGQTSSQTLTLAVGQIVTLNLGLGGVPETGPAGKAPPHDTVVVTVKAMVDTNTSEVATYRQQHKIGSLPHTNRHYPYFHHTAK